MTTCYVITDSYGAYNGSASFPYVMAAQLGWTLTVDAIGGTCYSGVDSFGSRVAAAIAAAPDVAIIVGSVNDRWGVDSDVAAKIAAVTAALSALKAGVPVVYASLFNGSDGVVSGYSWGPVALAATRDALIAGANAAGVPFINGVGWISGTGKVDAPTGDGNADLYVVADGVHPTVAGSFHTGVRLADAIAPPSTGLPGHILLESGIYGYLLEDGSGVLARESRFRIEVAGVDLLSGLHISGEPTVTNTAYRQSGVMTFRAEGLPGSFAILSENPVLWRDTLTEAIYYGGLVKTVTPVPGVPGWRVLDIECQDYTILASMDIIGMDPAPWNPLEWTYDSIHIANAFAAFGTKGIIVGAECQTIDTNVVWHLCPGATLAEFMDELCKITGARWYVDYSKHLHYFLAESEVAPFDISDTPNFVTTFFGDNLTLPEDTIDLRNSVLFIPGAGGDAVPTVYEDAVSIAEVAARSGDDGRRKASVHDETILYQSELDSAGAAFLAANAKKHPGSFTCYQPGLRAGMSISITSADDGLTAEPFVIQSVTTRLVQAGETMADSYVAFDVAIGDRPATLSGTMARIANRPAQQQLANANGTVVIGATGVVVKNVGDTVIIDGTSDMFKIAATGTLTTALINPGPGSASAHVDLSTGFTYNPTVICYIQGASGIAMPTHYLQWDIVLKTIINSYEAYAGVVSTNQTRVTVTTSASGTVPAVSYRYFVMQEVAF